MRGPRSGVPEIDAVSSALTGIADPLDNLLAANAFAADAAHQLRTTLTGLRLTLKAAGDAVP